jgi:hypothetical protein
MVEGKPDFQPAATMSEAIEAVKQRVGRTRLSKEDILLLCAGELSRTFTYDEKDYRG